MSVERYVNFADVTCESSAYGSACKNLVNALLAADDCFSIAQVDTDTSSSYKVWLQLYDSNIYLYLYNSSSTVYYCIYYGISGTALTSSSNLSMFSSWSAGFRCGAVVSRLGDFLITVHLQQSYNTNGIYLWFARGVSEYNGATYWFVSCSTGGSGIGTYTCPAPLHTSSTSNTSTIALTGVNTSTGVKTSYRLTAMGMTSVVTTSIGAMGVLNPVAYCGYAYDATDWVGHIKWGGLYDVYTLFNTSGVYTITPTADYIVDGVTYKGVFANLLIPVPCD